LAIEKGYDYIVCGHIHHPDMRIIKDTKGNSITYLNSGDWIENLTSLEYNKGEWNIYYYLKDFSLHNEDSEEESPDALEDMDNKQLFKNMINEFHN
jgi:hypothetical protein